MKVNNQFREDIITEYLYTLAKNDEKEVFKYFYPKSIEHIKLVIKDLHSKEELDKIKTIIDFKNKSITMEK